MLERYLKMILNSRVYDVAIETPLVIADRLSERLRRATMRRVSLSRLPGGG
jgi:hypothetical protein